MLILNFAMLPQVVRCGDAGSVGRIGLDAMLLQDSPQAEDLALGGGELVFEVGDGGPAGGAFLAELDGQGVHHGGVCLG